MIWYILILFFITLLLWILLAPVIVLINTEGNRYLITLPGVISLMLVPREELFMVRGWIFFIPFKIDPFKRKKAKPRKEKERVIKMKRSKNRFGNIKIITEAIRSIRIRKLWLDIDTDDYALNAWLVPVFSAVNQTGNIRMQVNFEGNLSLYLDFRTRISRLLWILFRNR